LVKAIKKVFDGATTFMVMVIAFLTLTNIALGYGLAVYVQKHFGTLMYRRKPKAVAAAISQVTAPGAVAAAPVSLSGEAPAPVAPPAPAPVVVEAAAPPAPTEVIAKAETAAVEVQAESDTVDEENVLAGIEEFRSQLAKMSEATEQFADDVQPELVGAAN
jgi:type IV secretory pathway VirB10-like protein